MKIWTALVVLMLMPAVAMAGRGVVLVVQSYHPSLDWTRLTDQGIADILGAAYDIHTVHMDTKRLPKDSFTRQADLAWEKFLRLAPDLVMVGDDDALRLLGPRLARSTVPFVYFGINNNPRTYFTTLPPTMVGVLERTPVIPWLRHLATILPSARRALVLFDDSDTSAGIIADTFQKRAVLNVGSLSVRHKIAQDWQDWQDAVRADDHDILVTPTFHAVKNRAGQSESWADVIVWTAANSPVPVFSNQDYTVHDRGVVGAYTLQGREHGRAAAAMALDILTGKRVTGIAHKTDVAGRFIFNQKGLDRHGIVLPEDIRRQATFQ